MKFDFGKQFKSMANSIKVEVPHVQQPELALIGIDDAKNEHTYKAEEATINSEQHLQELKETVNSLQDELATERKERALADEENKQYTKKVDRKNSIIAIASLVVAIISMFVAFLK